MLHMLKTTAKWPETQSPNYPPLLLYKCVPTSPPSGHKNTRKPFTFHSLLGQMVMLIFGLLSFLKASLQKIKMFVSLSPKNRFSSAYYEWIIWRQEFSSLLLKGGDCSIDIQWFLAGATERERNQELESWNITFYPAINCKNIESRKNLSSIQTT